MQEDVEHKSIMLIINASKMSARALRNAIIKYLNHIKEYKPKTHDNPPGKQSLKKLVHQGQGASNIEITDGNIKSFERVARKYGINYALKKDTTGDKPKYLVFFKAKDTDVLTAAFKEYAAKTSMREKRPSVLAKLRRMKEMLKSAPKREKHKGLDR